MPDHVTTEDGLSVLPWARGAYDSTIKLAQMLPPSAEREAACRAAEFLSDVINGLRKQVTFGAQQSNPTAEESKSTRHD